MAVPHKTAILHLAERDVDEWLQHFCFPINVRELIDPRELTAK